MKIPSMIYIFISILFQSLVAVLAKYFSYSINISIFDIVTNVYYYLILALLGFQALSWQQALKNYPLSFAYPLMGLVNFIVLVLAFILFNEKILLSNIVGLSTISIGIYMVSRDLK